jgi:hypothetical protein
MTSLNLRAEDDGELASEGQKEEWLRQARAWLETGNEDAQASDFRPKGKLHRLSAQRHVLALDAGLQHVTGAGLSQFVVPEDQLKLIKDGKPFSLPPSLSICQDQGSIGFSAMWFLVYELRACVSPMIDPLHRVANDCKLALGACKLRPHVWVSTVVMNMVFGPWDGQTFWSDILAGWKEYLAHADGPQDPLFQELLPFILDDFRIGEPCEGDADDLAWQAWQRLRDGEGFSRKGNKVNLTRRFAWNSVAMEFDKVWHLRLVVQAFMGLRLGWLAKESKAFQVSVSNPVAPADGARDTTNKKKADATTRLRDQCKNTMHMSTTWLLDRSNQLRSRMVFTLQHPLWDWYAATNTSLRDPANCMQFNVDNAGGLFFGSCLAVMAKLHVPEQLEFMGFTVAFTPGVLKKYSPDHPDVLTQDGMALEAWGFALSLVRFRLRGMMHLWAMWPGMTALLLHTDAAVRAQCVAKLKADYAAYCEALVQPATTVLTRALARSPFRQVVMQVVVALLLRAEWEITEQLLVFVRPLWSGLGQSLIIEDPQHDLI